MEEGRTGKSGSRSGLCGKTIRMASAAGQWLAGGDRGGDFGTLGCEGFIGS